MLLARAPKLAGTACICPTRTPLCTIPICTTEESIRGLRSSFGAGREVATWKITGRRACVGRGLHTAASVSITALRENIPTVCCEVLPFAPCYALLGGLMLGSAAAATVLLSGRVLGISGILKGVLHGNRDKWRFAFLAGMLAAALPVAMAMPAGFASFETFPGTFTAARTAAGGLLVGLGTALGNGCTSGHGICGNARLSPRSMAYTATFMVAGAAAATLSGTLSALSVPEVAPVFARISKPHVQMGAAVLGAYLLTATAAGLLGRRLSAAQQSLLDIVFSGITGAVFTTGLIMTAMTRPSMVAGFLSPLSKAWDGTLAFVMIAAIGVALPAFQSVLGKLWAQPTWASKPQIAPAYCLPPPNGAIDVRLLLGGVLFGAGWGLSGMCPGPALVCSLVVPGPELFAYLACMITGMLLEPVLTKVLTPKPKLGQA